MADPVHALLELQAHDVAIVRLQKELDEMPEKRAILQVRAKLAEIAALQARTETALHAIDAASKQLEDRIASVKNKMAAEQAKLVSGDVANPKELQAVSRELDALRRTTEKLEAELLSSMEKREAGVAQKDKIAAAYAQGGEKESELTARFKRHGGEIIAKIEAEKAARTTAAAALDAQLLERYESLRVSRHGLAVGVLADGMCDACRVGLPSGKVAALQAGPDIATCPSCARILIVRGA